MTCNLMVDLRIEPLQAGHPKVLQALRYGIDYEGFLNVPGGGYGSATEPDPPGMLGYEEKRLTTTPTILTRPSRLAEAGYPDGFKVTC